MPRIMTIEERLDQTRFENAFSALVKRHESLRTSFKMVDGEPVQIVHEDVDLNMSFFKATEDEIETIVKDFIKPFNLNKAPLFRLALIVCGDKNILMFDMHHIITDGTSMFILINDLIQLYIGKNLEPLHLQYRDFTVWQNNLFQSDEIKKQEEFWLETFGGDAGGSTRVPELNIPTDYPRAKISSFEGAQLEFILEKELSTQLMELAGREKTTLYMVLLAAYSIMLAKYIGEEDIIIGTPIAGRIHPDVENIIGMFVNTLAMRNRPEAQKTCLEFLKDVKENALLAYENQEYPFEMLVEQLNLQRDLSRNPLFDTVFALQNFSKTELDISGVKLSQHEFENKITKFDLSLTAFETEQGLLFNLEYCTKLFKKGTIERIRDHFINIVREMIANPESKIAEIKMFSEEEKEQLLFEFNDTDLEFPEDKTIQQLFEEQVEKTPENIAVVFKDQQLTYRELNQKANQLARVLRDKGIMADQLVGIMVEPSLEMMIGILAIIKSGGAYLPLDPKYPKARIEYMLADSETQLVIVQNHLEDCVQSFPVEVINLSEEGLYDGYISNLENINSSADLVYVIYTSGTTGKPKGILTMHYNVSRVVLNTNYIEITPEDNVLQLSNYAFDGSTFDIYGALLNGATLVMIQKEIILEPARLANFIQTQDITIFFVTTALFNTLVDINLECFGKIRKVLFGGERVSVEHVKKALAYLGKDKIIHVYGPTETTVFATYYPVNSVEEEIVPIGSPLSNTQVYIVDKNINLQPIGVSGEICISGDGVARGYLNRPDLTAEKFIDNPFVSGKMLYKTGDLAKMLPDGNIEFLGRIDHQVKIRGFRIELGEIESCLLSHSTVKEAIVIDYEDGNHGKYLCAYLVTYDGQEILEIRDYLLERLPTYMIPSHFMNIAKIPLTRNGKIDRKALPDPTERSGGEIIAPRNAIEEQLLKIWQDVLGIEVIGVTDDFFEIGGHSLKATRLTAHISKIMNIEVALKEIFENPIIAELAEVIAGKEESIYTSIEPVEEKEYYPASSAQKRLFVLDQLETNSMTYNMPFAMIIEEALDKDCLEKALNELIKRHEALRTSFKVVDGEVVQKVLPELDFKIIYLTANQDQLEDLIAEFIRPFDLNKVPLFRVELVKFGENKYLLMMDTHHIISDGVSQTIFFNELIKLYRGKELPQLKIQYKDFAVWQNQYLKSERMTNQENYWLNTFADEIPVLNLPTDYPRPAVTSFAGDVFTFNVDKELTTKLNNLARQNGATLYMVTLAALNILLSKYSDQEDIIIGTAIAGRSHADLANILGMFVNTLAYRNKPQRKKSFVKFLNEVKENALKAFENQDYQFEMLVDKLKLERDLGRNPLFDVMFDLHLPDKQQTKYYLECKRYQFNVNTVKFDLDIMGVETETGIRFSCGYRSDLFNQKTIEKMVKHLVNILNEITTNPEIKISDIEMITEEEKQQVLFENNSKTISYPKDKVFHQLFEEQVEKTPDNLAIVFENQQLTYCELNQKSNQLARVLREKGITRDQIIGIMVERSLEMIIGVMGILKAGGAYLPIDPEYPEERIIYMIEDSNAQIVLTQNHLAEKINSKNEVIYLSEDIYCGDDSNLVTFSHPHDLAYVIYTSGSTGRPKGVLVQHNHFVNIAWGWRQEYHLTDIQVNLLQMASFSFDVFAGDLARTLLNGGKMVICPGDVRIDYPTLYSLTREHQITLFEATPSLIIPFMEYVYEEKLPMDYLRLLILGSDSCRVEDFRKLMLRFGKMMRIINSYGVSEATIDSSYYEETLDNIPKTGNVPIGKPLPNVEMYILGNNLEIKPTGIYGELYIGGDSVARGYLNKPELTSERFINNPYVPGERIYKTGDLARWLPDGNIEFAGRTDFQVKIRGYRIETGEIENQLLTHAGIKEVAVIDRNDSSGTKYLCGYIVTDIEISLTELRTFLGGKLPEYMIPSYFVKMDKLPLTPNGKIDRKALPEADGSINTGVEYIAPTDEVEEKLAQIFSEILTIEKVGVIDDFFEIGGHSLSAMQLVTKIHREFNVNVPLREIFINSTIKEVAQYIKNAEKIDYVTIKPVEEREYYLTSSAQKRLYLMRQLGTGIEYNMPTAWSIIGNLDKEILEKTIQTLINRHETLRTSFELINGELIQRVHKDVNYEIEYMDATTDEIPRILNEFVKPFDLGKPPLFRIQYVKSMHENLLLLDMHHIISDGLSDDILIREFATLYEGRTLPELPIQYKDYAVWQNEILKSGQLKQQEEYWLEQFAGNIPVLNMPTEYQRTNSTQAKAQAIVIDEELTIKLNDLASSQDVTLYMVLLSICNILMSKYTGQEDIVIGSPIAGRTHADLENIIGVFINTLAMRNEPKGEKTFAEFLEEVKENAFKAYENQDYPFDMLVDKLHIKRNPTRNPLLDVFFNLQTEQSRTSALQPNTLKVRPANLNFTVARFDFKFDAMEINSKIYLSLEYRAQLYKEENIKRMLNDYVEIIKTVVENNYIKLEEINLIDELKEIQKVTLSDIEFDL